MSPKPIAAIAAALLAASCATVPAASNDPQRQFFDNVLAMCGKTLTGRIASPPSAADADFAGKEMVMHVRDCSPNQIRIPFRVGDDRSRTWVLSRVPDGIELKHDHRHEDGSEDKLSQYGGTTVSPGTARRQEFPADQFSRELFVRESIPQSTTNVWAMEAAAPGFFAYELRRPNRFFRVEFSPLPTR